MTKLKGLILAVFVVLLAAYFLFDLGRFLTLDYVQSQLGAIQEFARNNFASAAAAYFVFYVVVTALSIPGAAIVTLVGGAVFGLLWGTVLVSFASTIGATLAFLTSRLLLRDWVQNRFGRTLKTINDGIEKDGNFYLFSLRMVPLFPFFVVNLLMGLTPIKVVPYFLISQIGMLLGTAVYVNAGAELGQIESLSGLVSAPIILSFALLGVFPWIARALLGLFRRAKPPKAFPRPRQFEANVVVIGAGSAGLVSSIIAAGAKAKVVLIEKHRMGGDCLNTGCVPSKALIRSARVADYLKRASEFGIDNATGTVNFAKVMERVQRVVTAIEPHDSVERFTSLGVECVSGEAFITSPWSVQVGERTITTRSIVIATGARPFVPPIPGLEQIDYLTSDSLWEIRELPQRLLVLGAGPIGCELAQSFARLGSQVTLIDQAQRIMPREDDDVAALVMQRFEQGGVRVLTGCKAQSFVRDESSSTLLAQTVDGQVTLPFDKVLIAIGRKANVEGFGLEELGMPLETRGTLKVNQYLQTAYPNIYACGDVAGPYQFTHMASFQAWFATLNALLGGLKKFIVNYNVVPWATFTDPEVARVGLNEQEAKELGIAYDLTRYEIDDLDRAIADEEAHGFVKVLTQPGSDRILGATIVGYHSGELITEFVLAMTHGLGLKKIGATTHIYPTLSEANRFAANAWRNARIPKHLLPWAEKFFRWRLG
ncbi:MAG: FAD-dependent oxidoreductase [Gammaproteobacteria bacterium]|nr:FAD-dependent oxidoreductase [Gammaproteobacteria bacterium]MDP2139969.1 FAD-dependent oxidoreductase [Gammaproteobacteria bacterium]MDP2347789.1 FAD-dependent oxidoreductase [Gammaproteobacteria bacterium]